MKLYQKLSVCALALGTLVTLGCGKEEAKPAPKADSKIEVVASFEAISQLAKEVGKDKVSVHTVIPEGQEPHDFELKPENLKSIAEGKVFITNGFGMEPWAEKAIESAGNKKLTTVVASDGLTPIKLTGEEAKEHGENDPHVWLSPRNTIVMVKNIEKAYAKADPSNKQYYADNAQKIVDDLLKLDEEYKGKFKEVSKRNIVTGHAAFGYLARDYDLEQESIEDVYGEGEPNPAQLAELVQYAKDNHVTTIFSEEMASPKVSETLAKEVGAKVVPIDTLEGKEDGKSYVERLRENLEKIYESLK